MPRRRVRSELRAAPLDRGAIALVGLGPTFDLRHMTRDAYDFLSQVGRSRDRDLRVYALDAALALRHAVLARAAAAGLCRDLRPFYALRPLEPARAYQAVAELLLRRAQGGRRVVFLAMGNPLFWALPSLLVRRLAAEAGVPVRVFASPSFLDLALAHMDTTGLEGLVVALGPGVVRGTPPLLPGVSVLIGQISDGSGLDALRYVGPGAPALRALRDKLLETYAADHPAVLIVADGPSARLASRRIRVGELADHEDVGAWANLYVPSPPVPAP